MFLSLTRLIAKPAFGNMPGGRGQYGMSQHLVTRIITIYLQDYCFEKTAW